MEIIQVIDTAVKVGLGAMISGVATYWGTKESNNSSRKRERAQRTYDALLLSTERIELYITALGNCLSGLDGITRRGAASGPFKDSDHSFFLERYDKPLCERYHDLNIAISRLHLIGESEAAKVASEFKAFENRLRQIVVFDGKIPSKEDFDKFKKDYKQLKKDIYEALAHAYKTI